MPGVDGFVLAAFVAGFPWRPGGEEWTADLPEAVPTVSDCLTDFLPADQEIDPWQQSLSESWHRTLRHASDAVRHTWPSPGHGALSFPAHDPRPSPSHEAWSSPGHVAQSFPARVLSMSVPADRAAELLTMMEDWIDDLPHPILQNLARPEPAPPGTIRGFEVLGFDYGRFHSWLCYRLDRQAVDRLGIRPGDAGLLTSLNDAARVATLANGNRGVADGTPLEVDWFPALITEHALDGNTP